MVIAWLLTLPAAALVGAIAGWTASTGNIGALVVAAAGIAIAVGLYLASRRNPVDAANVNDEPVKTGHALPAAA